MSDDQVGGKAPKDRSPSFPFIPLQTAVERLLAFEQMFGRHDTPAIKAGKAWGMKDGSSQAFQTTAALKAFGFVDYRGSGPTRPTFITEEGRVLLRAQQDSIKREVLRRAALKPKIIERFWHEWGADRPIDDICIDDLHFKHGFTIGAAQTFLRVYDATIAYAGLGESDKKAPEEEAPPLSAVDVGDTVQVEINGQQVLPAPTRVRAVQEHGGVQWVFLDGSEAGVRMEQVQLVQKGLTPPPVQPLGAAPVLPLESGSTEPARTAKGAGWKEERLIDDAGEETFLSYKGEPSVERYEFIRDYLDFRIKRLKPPSPGPTA